MANSTNNYLRLKKYPTHTTQILYLKKLLIKVAEPNLSREHIFNICFFLQETRHIIAALVQHITFNEFLPMVLGKEVMQSHDLVLLKDGYFDRYDRYSYQKYILFSLNIFCSSNYSNSNSWCSFMLLNSIAKIT